MTGKEQIKSIESGQRKLPPAVWFLYLTFDFILLLAVFHHLKISRRVKSAAFSLPIQKGEHIMFHQLCTLLEKPPLYTKSKAAFWDDEYISKQMLKAHLDPGFEGASRKLDFIDSSAAWIKKTVNPTLYPTLLDIGCGPGIYAERFAKAGYQVTGIDFSKRSIAYAKDMATQQGLNIKYLYQNYLSMDLKETFDFCTMIYCDYGALSSDDRQIIMSRGYRHLRQGGRFLLDVFSMTEYDAFQEGQSWKMCNGDGFWKDGEYIELSGRYKYPGNVTLEQTIVISDADSAAYYLWNTCFTKDLLIQEALAAGFHVCGIFSDVAGGAYQEECPTIAVLLEK